MMKNVTILTSDEVRRIEVELETMIEKAQEGLEGKLESEDAFGWLLTSAKRIKQYLEEV